MDDLAPLLRFWRALDDLLERVEPTWWGAVVTDPRFPGIWDVNYARVETTDQDLTLAEVEAALRPALAKSRAGQVHLVLSYPEELTRLLSELGARGDRLSWDVAMLHRGDAPPPRDDVPVEEVHEFDDNYWNRHRASLREFEVIDEAALDQLARIEQDVEIPAGKRWFMVRGDDEIKALGSLMVLEGVAYVDHVVTFPEARGRGYASAIVSEIAAESSRAGAERIYLLAELESKAVALYERLGFERIGQLASSLRPME